MGTSYSRTLLQKQSELQATQKRLSRDNSKGEGISTYEKKRISSGGANVGGASLGNQHQTIGFTEYAASSNAPISHSRAEMDLQLRDLEYKIGAAERKTQDLYRELRD